MEAAPVSEAEEGSEKNARHGPGKLEFWLGCGALCDVASKVDAAALHGVAGLR